MMKNSACLMVLLSCISLRTFGLPDWVDCSQTVNAVIGDVSFETRFGRSPLGSDDEDLRITTHLSYVEDLLRQKDVSLLTKEMQSRRNHVLDLLHEYWTNGIFPRNYDHPDRRKPCFIDRNGNICAVGYLIEKTSGRAVAEEVNRLYQYGSIYEMNVADVDGWIAASGLTEEECAMIQPQYAPESSNANYISPADGSISAFFSGVNLSLNAINGIQISRGTNHNAAGVMGIFMGTAQLIFGATSMPEETLTIGGIEPTTNESLKTLCFINIGIGTSTLFMSTWNLVANKKKKSPRTSWNMHGFSTGDGHVGLGLNFRRTF